MNTTNNTNTKEYNDIFSEAIYNTVASFIKAKEPFVILMKNNNNWSKELPKRLQGHDKFMIKIEEQTIEDSYVDDKGKIIINTVFDEEEYSIELETYDIAAIMNNEMTAPIMLKPFEEFPKIEVKREDNTKVFTEPTEEEMRPSMEVFKKNNPELFKK